MQRLRTISSFFDFGFGEWFFFQIKNSTPATIATSPLIETRGITVKGPSLGTGSSLFTTLLFLSSTLLFISSLGISSGGFGGLRVVVSESGTVSSVSSSITLVKLCVVDSGCMNIGNCGTGGNRDCFGGIVKDGKDSAGGCGFLRWPVLSVMVAYISVRCGIDPSCAVTHREYERFSWK